MFIREYNIWSLVNMDNKGVPVRISITGENIKVVSLWTFLDLIFRVNSSYPGSCLCHRDRSGVEQLLECRRINRETRVLLNNL